MRNVIRVAGATGTRRPGASCGEVPGGTPTLGTEHRKMADLFENPMGLMGFEFGKNLDPVKP